MGGALGFGTPTYNPAATGMFGSPWLGGSPVGQQQTPQLLHALQQLLQLQYAQQQQLQHLAQLLPQQQQLIQHLIQTVAHQQQQPFSMWQQQQQPFASLFQSPTFLGSSGWLGSQSAQPSIFGGQPGYVM
jgi:hypothetical protein